mmetsp:Transcript_23143/g.36200  ORF Transcript_23143/g.36200 Transcript_23143/m.36200 type:complete len:263 (+) Transcript_23143:35-823(+)
MGRWRREAEELRGSESAASGGDSDSEDVEPGEPSVRLFPRRKAGEAKSRGFRGRAPSVITLRILSRYFGMPQLKACQELEISLATMKRVCRKFGVTRWPGITSDAASSEPSPSAPTSSASSCSSEDLPVVPQPAAAEAAAQEDLAADAEMGAEAGAQSPGGDSEEESQGESSDGDFSPHLGDWEGLDGLDACSPGAELGHGDCFGDLEYPSRIGSGGEGIERIASEDGIWASQVCCGQEQPKPDSWLCQIDPHFLQHFVGDQ